MVQCVLVHLVIPHIIHTVGAYVDICTCIRTWLSVCVCNHFVMFHVRCIPSVKMRLFFLFSAVTRYFSVITAAKM